MLFKLKGILLHLQSLLMQSSINSHFWLRFKKSLFFAIFQKKAGKIFESFSHLILALEGVLATPYLHGFMTPYFLNTQIRVRFIRTTIPRISY